MYCKYPASDASLTNIHYENDDFDTRPVLICVATQTPVNKSTMTSNTNIREGTGTGSDPLREYQAPVPTTVSVATQTDVDKSTMTSDTDIREESITASELLREYQNSTAFSTQPYEGLRHVTIQAVDKGSHNNQGTSHPTYNNNTLCQQNVSPNHTPTCAHQPIREINIVNNVIQTSPRSPWRFYINGQPINPVMMSHPQYHDGHESLVSAHIYNTVYPSACITPPPYYQQIPATCPHHNVRYDTQAAKCEAYTQTMDGIRVVSPYDHNSPKQRSRSYSRDPVSNSTYSQKCMHRYHDQDGYGNDDYDDDIVWSDAETYESDDYSRQSDDANEVAYGRCRGCGRRCGSYHSVGRVAESDENSTRSRKQCPKSRRVSHNEEHDKKQSHLVRSSMHSVPDVRPEIAIDQHHITHRNAGYLQNNVCQNYNQTVQAERVSATDSEESLEVMHLTCSGTSSTEDILDQNRSSYIGLTNYYEACDEEPTRDVPNRQDLSPLNKTRQVVHNFLQKTQRNRIHQQPFDRVTEGDFSTDQQQSTKQHNDLSPRRKTRQVVQKFLHHPDQYQTCQHTLSNIDDSAVNPEYEQYRPEYDQYELNTSWDADQVGSETYVTPREYNKTSQLATQQIYGNVSEEEDDNTQVQPYTSVPVTEFQHQQGSKNTDFRDIPQSALEESQTNYQQEDDPDYIEDHYVGEVPHSKAILNDEAVDYSGLPALYIDTELTSGSDECLSLETTVEQTSTVYRPEHHNNEEHIVKPEPTSTYQDQEIESITRDTILEMITLFNEYGVDIPKTMEDVEPSITKLVERHRLFINQNDNQTGVRASCTSSLTQEQNSQIAYGGEVSLTQDQNSQVAHGGEISLTHEQNSQAAHGGEVSLTQEQNSQIAHGGVVSQTSMVVLQDYIDRLPLDWQYKLNRIVHNIMEDIGLEDSETEESPRTDKCPSPESQMEDESTFKFNKDWRSNVTDYNCHEAIDLKKQETVSSGPSRGIDCETSKYTNRTENEPTNTKVFTTFQKLFVETKEPLPQFHIDAKQGCHYTDLVINKERTEDTQTAVPNTTKTDDDPEEDPALCVDVLPTTRPITKIPFLKKPSFKFLIKCCYRN